MTKQLTTSILLLLTILMSACQTETIGQATTTENIGYSSAKFTPSNQFKMHQVAAFVVPTDQANLSFQVSGIIEKQFIKIGDSVEEGQPLFKVGNPSLEPQIQQFQSQIDAIQATLAQNKAEVIRVKDLKKTNAISQNELDRLTNQQDNLLATKKSIEAQLVQAQSLFDETLLKAPFAGNIAEIYKEAGEVIGAGEAVLLVGGVTSLEASIYLPAFLHRDMRLGQPLIVQYETHDIKASVKEISLSANPKSQLFKVMLDIPIMHEIKSGEKVTVVINEHMGEYFRLPIESVIDDGINEPFVFLIENNQVIQTPIQLIDIENNEVIIQLDRQTEIEVVTAGQVNLSPKQNLSQL